MKKYKIEYKGCGVNYTPEYAQTISGALKVARKKGWRDDTEQHDMRPESALIFERVSESWWELVATITKHNIVAEDCESRRSVKSADRNIQEAKSVINEAYTTMTAFNAIVNKEYAKEKS